MKDEIEHLKINAFKAIEAVCDLTALQAIRVDFLGKKGSLTEVLKQVVHLSAAEKPLIGQAVNVAKRDINERIETKFVALKEQQLTAKIHAEKIDVTLDGRKTKSGSRHPVAQIKQRISEYFSRLGFDSGDGPERETDF